MCRLGFGVIVGVLAALPMWGQYQPATPDSGSGKKFWAASVATLLASSAADAHSSMGRGERNPLLQSAGGTFGWRGVAIKGGIKGGFLAMQWLILRKHPEAAHHAAFANFAMAGVFGGIAFHNYGNSRSAAAPLPQRPPYLLASPPGVE